MTIWMMVRRDVQDDSKERTDNVAGYQFSGFDFLLPALAYDSSFHGNVSLQTSHHVGSLLFLIPANNGIEEQDSNNKT